MYITKACLLHQSTELLATSHSTNTTVHSRLPTSRITTTLPSTAMTKDSQSQTSRMVTSFDSHHTTADNRWQTSETTTSADTDTTTDIQHHTSQKMMTSILSRTTRDRPLHTSGKMESDVRETTTHSQWQTSEQMPFSDTATITDIPKYTPHKRTASVLPKTTMKRTSGAVTSNLAHSTTHSQWKTSEKMTSSLVLDTTTDFPQPTSEQIPTMDSILQTPEKTISTSFETSMGIRQTSGKIPTTWYQQQQTSPKDTSSFIRDATSDSYLPTLEETTPLFLETTVEAHKQTSSKLTTSSPETTTESRTSKKMTSNPLDDTTTHIESTEIQSTSASITTSSASTFSATTTTKPVTSANGRSTEALRTAPPAGM